MLDVGGGPGYFRDAFGRPGATYFALDADVGELAGPGGIAPRHRDRRRDAAAVRDGAVDVCYSSNVLEHVPDPWRMADEMLRVTRPGGLVFISLHRLVRPVGRPRDRRPGTTSAARRARRRYRRKHGHEPKNKYGESLFPVTVARRAALGRAGSTLARCST